MLGDGLQDTLLAIRADQEGFSANITGLVMSSFYVGFLLGSITTQKLPLKLACPSQISDRLEFLGFSPPELKHRRHAQLDTRTP